MEYKIVERDNDLAIHSTGYFGEAGLLRAQFRVNSGYCKRHWLNKKAEFTIKEMVRP